MVPHWESWKQAYRQNERCQEGPTERTSGKDIFRTGVLAFPLPSFLLSSIINMQSSWSHVFILRLNSKNCTLKKWIAVLRCRIGFGTKDVALTILAWLERLGVGCGPSISVCSISKHLHERLACSQPPMKGNRSLYLQGYAIPATFIHKYGWMSQDCQIFGEINSTRRSSKNKWPKKNLMKL